MKFSTTIKAFFGTTKSGNLQRRPTYRTTGEAVHDHHDSGVAARIAEDKSMLTHVWSQYANLQARYSALPLHVRRDIHTAANEEIFYASAILEPDLKDLSTRSSDFSEDEILPFAPNWYTSLGQLSHDFGQKDVDRFSSEYITSLHNRVNEEVTRVSKVWDMVDHICSSAAAAQSAPIETLLKEWNFATTKIYNGVAVSRAVEGAIEESQHPSYDASRLTRETGPIRTYVSLDVIEAAWPSAKAFGEARSKPGPRWTPEVYTPPTTFAEMLTPSAPSSKRFRR